MQIRLLPALLGAALFLTPVPGAAQTPAPASSPAAAAPAAAASPAAAAPAAVDPKVEALARDLLHRIQTDTLDRSQMTAQVIAQMTPDLTKAISEKMAPLGDPTSFTFDGMKQADGLTIYQFSVAFKAITLKELIAITPDGKIAGLNFSK